MRSLINAAAACALAIGGVPSAVAAHGVSYVPIVVPTYYGPVAPPQNSGERSAYLKCDGNPAIMSDGEKFARFMGAITLLGLFAPRPEVPEPAARLFADKGVEACSRLIGPGPSQEKAVIRRLPLLLARAAHHIEAKQYTEALADVATARTEAKTLFLPGNPYFERSLGLSFHMLDAIAYVGLGDYEAARKAGLAPMGLSTWSVTPLLSSHDYSWSLRDGSPEEDHFQTITDKLFVLDGYSHAVRLEQLGRYQEASALREAIIAVTPLINSDIKQAWQLATAAVSHALAGNWDKAAARAEAAHAAITTADAAGTPDAARTSTLEYLDFYHVLLLAHQGRLDEARSLFTARSEWSISPGARFNTADMLRKGASSAQLIGPLAHSGEEQFNEQRQHIQAQILQNNADNKSLFSYILPYASVDDYERLSDAVWNLKQERFIKSETAKNSHYHVISGGLASPSKAQMIIVQDAMLLHAALAAKQAGFKGLLYATTRSINQSALVTFANPGADTPEQFYIDAEAVIAELRQLIPSPEELAARRANPGK